MVAIMEKRADEVGEEVRARFVNLLPDVIGYAIGARGGGACGFSEGAGDLLLTEGEVVSETRAVDVSLGRGGRGWKEVV